jgi:mucin-19
MQFLFLRFGYLVRARKFVTDFFQSARNCLHRTVHFIAFLSVAGATYVAAQTCSIPGNFGPNATLTAYPNGLYPGTIGTSLAIGATSIPVGALRSGPAVQAGSLLLVIQMQGATINSTNSNQYGDGSGSAIVPPASPTPPANSIAAGDITDIFGSANYAGGSLTYTAGTYEFVVATGAVAAGAIPLASPLVNGYSNLAATATQGQTRYQVIVVPQYSTATLGGTHTIPDWNGDTGGVEVIDVAGALNMGGVVIDGNGRGFRGGGGVNQTALCTGGAGTQSCQDYRATNATTWGAFKGEGIAGTPALVFSSPALANTGSAAGADGYPDGDRSRGAPGNAGGGGNQHNAGGGGGGNGGAGGKGGRSWNGSATVFSGQELGGFGGASGYGSSTRLIMGGGGGAGDVGGNTSTPAYAGAGGSGGGLVIIRAGSVSGTGTLNLNGGNGIPSSATDAGGAGGAGGTAFITATTGTLAGITVNANGGFGTAGNQGGGNETDGPGGGGGGGAVYSNVAVGTVNIAGGAAGTITSTINTECPSTNLALATCGATAGVAGVNVNNIGFPIAGTGALPGSECLPNITAAKSTTTPVRDALGATTANYRITLSNSGGGARNVSIIDNALPPGWTLSGTPTYTYAPTPPSAANSLASGAMNAAVPTVNPAAGAPATVPAAGANALTWSSFFIAPVKNGVPSTITIDFVATIPANAPVGCYHNPAGFTFLDPTRTTTAGTQLTAATNNGANRAAANYGTSAYAGNLIANVAGSNYSGLAAGPSAEDVCIRPDLSITKANSNPTPVSGGTFNYTITARNNGHTISDTTYAANQTTTATAAAVGPALTNVVTDTLPTGLVLSGTPTGTNWTCTGVAGAANFGCTYTGTYPWAAQTDLVGAITVPVRVTPAACPGPRVNTANLGTAQFAGNGVAGTAGESNTANNAAADGAGITPGCTAALSIAKTDAKAATISGATNTYSITVNNAGPAAADGARVTDSASAGLCATGAPTVTCASVGGATCPTAPLNFATLVAPGYVVPALPNGGGVTFTVTCAVSASGI